MLKTYTLERLYLPKNANNKIFSMRKLISDIHIKFL